MVQENSGKNEEALKAYEQAVKSGETSTEPESLLNLARVQAALGKTEDAKKSYDQVIQKHAGTEYARLAETRKVLLK
jgi:TolA-binding protein